MQQYRRPWKFLRADGLLCFNVDQSNALDPEPKEEDNVPDEEKSTLGSLLRRMVAGHVEITSASANHKTVEHMERIQATNRFHGWEG